MNQYLKQKLDAKIKSEDILLSDYKDLDENLCLEDINFQKVRGSVRLLLRRIYTPKDAKQLKEKVLAMDFGE
jgi:hypothetical protein